MRADPRCQHSRPTTEGCSDYPLCSGSTSHSRRMPRWPRRPKRTPPTPATRSQTVRILDPLGAVSGTRTRIRQGAVLIQGRPTTQFTLVYAIVTRTLESDRRVDVITSYRACNVATGDHATSRFPSRSSTGQLRGRLLPVPPFSRRLEPDRGLPERRRYE